LKFELFLDDYGAPHFGGMTGFTSLPMPEEGHDNRQQKFRGVARILGPRWAQFPTITIGLLGVQIFWSVQTSYCALLSFVDLKAY